MEFGGASSLVLALAVALWLAYFVPSWVRQHNYLATEKNAVRLQQALRVLAETAELPSEVNMERSMRSVTDQQRKLRRARRAADEAERERLAAAKKSLPEVAAMSSIEDYARARAATRRGRLAATCVMTFALVSGIVGAWLGFSNANWWPLVASVVVLLAGFAMLSRLARVAKAQRLAAEQAIAQQRKRAAARADRPAVVPDLASLNHPVAEAVAQEVQHESTQDGWTPTSIPKPLYLSRSVNAVDGGPDGPSGPQGPGGPGGPGSGPRASTDQETPEQDHVALLMAAARRSEQAIRDAHKQPGVATFGRAEDSIAQAVSRAAIVPAIVVEEGGALLAKQASTPQQQQSRQGAARETVSRWATMGIVDDAESDFDGVNAVLRRRRAS